MFRSSWRRDEGCLAVLPGLRPGSRAKRESFDEKEMTTMSRVSLGRWEQGSTVLDLEVRSEAELGGGW